MTLSRRDFLAASSLSLGCFAAWPLVAQEKTRKKLAVVSTVYHTYSHSDHIAGRFLYGYTLGGKHHVPDYQVVSMYVDQVGSNDLSVGLSKKFGFRHCKTVREALTNGGDKLAVDAVLLVGEHGRYPRNDIGQTLYPRHQLFSEIVDEFRKSGRAVPVFNDKHLSYSWTKAKEMYDWSRELNFAFQAGSSLPVTWRFPELTLPLGTKIDSALVAAYGGSDAYGFHALETLQCHVERRPGGETGVRSVRMLAGDDVWKAGDSGLWSKELLEAALGRSHTMNLGDVRENVSQPLAFLVEYRDGFKGTVLMLNGHIEEFIFAAKLAGKPTPVSTLHHLPARPAVKYFDALTWNAERMYAAGKAVIPIERTLLVSGVLESLHQSRAQESKTIETPHLAVAYQAPEDDGHFRGPIDPIGQRESTR